MNTEEILNEREKTHGDYTAVSELTQELKDAAYIFGKNTLGASQKTALDMIFLKIARIMCGDPNHADHWDDIAGYAMLGRGKEETLCKACALNIEFGFHGEPCDKHIKARCDELLKEIKGKEEVEEGLKKGEGQKPPLGDAFEKWQDSILVCTELKHETEKEEPKEECKHENYRFFGHDVVLTDCQHTWWCVDCEIKFHWRNPDYPFNFKRDNVPRETIGEEK